MLLSLNDLEWYSRAYEKSEKKHNLRRCEYFLIPYNYYFFTEFSAKNS